MKEGDEVDMESVEDWSDDLKDHMGLDWSGPDQVDLDDFSDDEALEWLGSKNNLLIIQRTIVC